MTFKFLESTKDGRNDDRFYCSRNKTSNPPNTIQAFQSSPTMAPRNTTQSQPHRPASSRPAELSIPTLVSTKRTVQSKPLKALNDSTTTTDGATWGLVAPVLESTITLESESCLVEDENIKVDIRANLRVIDSSLCRDGSSLE